MRFFIRGGAALRRGGSLVNFLQIGRVKPELFSTGGGSQFFWQGKNYSMSLLFCIYSRLPITRTFKGPPREIKKRFELSGVRVIASSKKIAEIKVNKKTPEGVYAGCVGVRTNYRYVEWQWKVE